MMQTFEEHKVVDQDDLDNLAHVNNVRYVQWVQDIAEKHWESKVTQDIKFKYYWILLTHNISYKNPAILGDVLKLVTYVEKSEGVRSIRKVDIYNENTDQLLVESRTTWCLISRENNKPSRITDELRNLFN